jgi:hypothetical protein
MAPRRQLAATPVILWDGLQIIHKMKARSRFLNLIHEAQAPSHLPGNAYPIGHCVQCAAFILYHRPEPFILKESNHTSPVIL